ncbi:MAG: hypothetical protein U0Q55_19615 [Vicinamibacterales bacterium]
MQEDQRAAVVNRLRQRLLAEAAAGGWGYYVGRSPRIEPTSWALLALGETWAGPGSWEEFARPRLAFLASRQTATGLLSDTDADLANLTANGLAAVLCARHTNALPISSLHTRLVDGIVALQGVRLDEQDARQDNQLQAWPWVRDTFSWVEPTAWCLLALKRLPSAARMGPVTARITAAHAVLENRMCSGGGWNYGNASTLGQDLRAYVPTTAVGLMALQDRTESTVVRESVARLSHDRLSEPATSTLALARIALGLHGHPADDVDDALLEHLPASENDGHVQAMAMALLALSMTRHRAEVFRVAA